MQSQEIPMIKRPLSGFVAIFVFLWPLISVHAAGGDDSDSTATTPTKSAAFQGGQKAIDAKDWNKAITEFKIAISENPKNADAFNYLGYAHRQKGEYDAAFDYYGQALNLNSNHRGANEYIGEAYLKTGNLRKAEHHLARLDDICTFGCAEYTMLKRAVKNYKATH